MTSGPVWPPDFAEALRLADESFAATGDAIEALRWIAFAAKVGLPLPAAIGRWFRGGIEAYLGDAESTLEGALGLDAQGAANPRRRLRERGRLENALARMYILHSLGATTFEAAAMVARVTDGLSVATLASRYARSGNGKRAVRDRMPNLANFSRTELAGVLADYPERGANRLDIQRGKRAIRAMYAKHRL